MSTSRRPPRRWRLTAACLLVLLSACVTVRPTAPTLRPWAARAAQLQAITHFSLDGRLAASNGGEGFTAGLRWQQQLGAASWQLSGPLGFGGARIQQQGGSLRITLSNGTTLEGAAARAQLARLLGFDPPLRSLRYWVLGVSDPQAPAEHRLDAQQRLSQLQQDGWQVVYDEYVPVQRLWLPRRLTLTRPPLRLRLVINAWQL